ncbi:MAG: hypothetical protein H6835_07680 [Planctomycetes bacterium]|nr:hypothetical protein [Planctomycetota bacterium]
MNPHPSRLSLASRPLGLPLGLSLLTLAACGGGGGGGGSTGAASLEDGLNRLGVNTNKTPRQSAPGLTIDEETTPLGKRPVLQRTDELLLLNIGRAGAPATDNPLVLLDVTDENGAAANDFLYGQSETQMPFLQQSENNDPVGLLRTAVPADVDQNGLQDLVFVYQSGIETRVRIVGDQLGGFGDVVDKQLASNFDVTQLTAVATDLDLDGRDDLVIGLVSAGSARVSAWRCTGADYVQLGSDVVVAPDLSGSQMWVQLCCGNVDADSVPEIGVAVQELVGATGTARTLVLDDVRRGLATLRNEVFSERDQDQVLRIPLTVSIAMGDIDGDGVDEVVLAGLTEFSTQCQSTKQLLMALDDRVAGFADLGVFYTEFFYSGCNSPSNRRVRTLFVNALDWDGDGVDEVAINQFVYDDFAGSAPWTAVADWQLPDNTVWDQNSFGFFDRTSASIIAGSFDGDDREDLAVYRQDKNQVRVFGLPATSPTRVESRTVTVPFANSQDQRIPLLVAANVDTDSAVLSYSEAEYKLVFSEPIVLAALAAPPTRAGIGQNVGGSFTAFGNTNTTTNESERSITFSAGVSVGVNIDGGVLTQSGFELKGTLTTAATRTQGVAYELSKTILFTSAPTEDTVVFTTVPVDQYTYTVMTHPDPTLVGSKVIVSYPRTPITLQAERGFYNASVPDGAQHVDASVFRHRVGEPSTYPTVAEKNQLRQLYGGLQVGPQAVGQGAGSTEVTLQVGSAVSTGGALEVGFQLDVETTAGSVLVGTSVGVSSTSTWKVTSGQSTTYTGVVGAIDAANFSANRYSFGLFTYVFRASGQQQFQVLDYWVE